ncbi:MAG: hypothetical protein K2M97_05220, partial [Muribaculaceae bacterium]|nr:hypothetical protein [Muribaculaceae bacterium]
RYFAINYVSPRHTGLMIDDVHFHAAYRPMNAVAYNLYRDGHRLNSEPLTERTYVDELTEPNATYTVRPIFELYGEGPESNVASITKSALDAIGAPSAVTIRAIAGAITVSGADEGTAARVYTPAGQLIASSTDSVIPVAPGLYIVRVGSTTAKVAVN